MHQREDRVQGKDRAVPKGITYRSLILSLCISFACVAAGYWAGRVSDGKNSAVIDDIDATIDILIEGQQQSQKAIGNITFSMTELNKRLTKLETGNGD